MRFVRFALPLFAAGCTVTAYDTRPAPGAYEYATPAQQCDPNYPCANSYYWDEWREVYVFYDGTRYHDATGYPGHYPRPPEGIRCGAPPPGYVPPSNFRPPRGTFHSPPNYASAHYPPPGRDNGGFYNPQPTHPATGVQPPPGQNGFYNPQPTHPATGAQPPPGQNGFFNPPPPGGRSPAYGPDNVDGRSPGVGSAPPPPGGNGSSGFIDDHTRNAPPPPGGNGNNGNGNGGFFGGSPSQHPSPRDPAHSQPPPAAPVTPEPQQRDPEYRPGHFQPTPAPVTPQNPSPQRPTFDNSRPVQGRPEFQPSTPTPAPTPQRPNFENARAGQRPEFQPTQPTTPSREVNAPQAFDPNANGRGPRRELPTKVEVPPVNREPFPQPLHANPPQPVPQANVPVKKNQPVPTPTPANPRGGVVPPAPPPPGH